MNLEIFNDHQIYILIAALTTTVGLVFTAYGQHQQNLSKFLSDWIDSLRKEASEYVSIINMISLLWDTELEIKNSKSKNEVRELTADELKSFRIEHKDAYIRMLESQNSIILRLHTNDSKSYEGILKKKLTQTTNRFIGNEPSCSIVNKKKTAENTTTNELEGILELVEQIIRRERTKIEKGKIFRLIMVFTSQLISVLLITFLSIMYFTEHSSKKDSQDPPESALNIKNEIRCIIVGEYLPGVVAGE